LRIRLAARYQRSAISGQLLNQHREHALDLGDFLRQFLVAAGWDQLQVVSQEDLVLQFARRAAGDQTEAC